MTSPKHPPPRPADLAIVGNRMLTGLLRRIWEIDYRQLAPDMGTSLVLMMLHMRISIATSEGNPLSYTQLSSLVTMPQTTVRSYVAILQKHHRVKLVTGRKRGRGHEQVIVANLDRLDRRITLEHVLETIEAVEHCLDELNRLAALLMPELVANGKKQAVG